MERTPEQVLFARPKRLAKKAFEAGRDEGPTRSHGFRSLAYQEPVDRDPVSAFGGFTNIACACRGRTRGPSSYRHRDGEHRQQHYPGQHEHDPQQSPLRSRLLGAQHTRPVRGATPRRRSPRRQARRRARQAHRCSAARSPRAAPTARPRASTLRRLSWPCAARPRPP